MVSNISYPYPLAIHTTSPAGPRAFSADLRRLDEAEKSLRYFYKEFLGHHTIAVSAGSDR